MQKIENHKGGTKNRIKHMNSSQRYNTKQSE